MPFATKADISIRTDDQYHLLHAYIYVFTMRRPTKRSTTRECILLTHQLLLILNRRIDNLSRFVLMVDLADPITLEERNIVKHSSQSPSISTVTTTSYPPTASSSSPAQNLPNYNIANLPGYASQNFAPPPRPAERSYGVNGTGSQPYYGNGLSHYGQQAHGPFAPRHNPQFPNPWGPQTPSSNQMLPPEPRNSVSSSASGTCTRNLIGSLSGSAFKLKDLKNEIGLWFVFQDLSIRTEGFFRLKFSFFDLMGELPTSIRGDDINDLSKIAPLLASIYSDPFHVYSAKKFPGVIESTALSKEFAKQGIKIPIRKDGGKDGDKSGGKRKRNGADDSEGSEDDLE